MKVLRGLKKSCIQSIYKDGNFLKGTLLTLKWNKGENRWCVTTPRSLGCHSRRNSVKRKLREALKQVENQNLLPINGVLNCTNKILKAKFSQIKEELNSLLNQLNTS